MTSSVTNPCSLLPLLRNVVDRTGRPVTTIRRFRRQATLPARPCREYTGPGMPVLPGNNAIRLIAGQ